VSRPRVATLVSPESFESFYGGMLALDRTAFVQRYRNDFVWDYGRALRERGLDVFVYVPAANEEGLDVAGDGFRVRFLRLARAGDLARLMFRRPLTPLDVYAAEAVNALALLRALRGGLRADRIDVLYVQEYWTARFDLVVRAVDIPVVAGEHGGSEGRKFHVGKRRSFARASALTCQSTAERRRLARYGTDATLITNGVDTEFFTPPGDAGARGQSVLVVGRLSDAQKRISDLIRALPLLPDPWQLEIAGSGPDERSLRALAESLGVGERVRFHGFVADKSVLRERYRAAGVFALPSVWEAMTIALLEAMSCGMAPVVTPLRPFRDLIDDGRNGLFLTSRAPRAIAAAIEQAYERRHELGEAARARVVEGYSQRDTMDRLAALLHDAAARR
jgi:glycosyltransferase involved in cell wall biosynthesis